MLKFFNKFIDKIYKFFLSCKKICISFVGYNNIILMLLLMSFIAQGVGFGVLLLDSISFLKLYIQVLLTVLLFAGIFELIFICHKINVRIRKNEYALIKSKDSDILKNLKELIESYKEMAHFCYEYNSQVGVICELIAENKNTAALEYMKKIGKSICLKPYYVNTQFDILNIVLNNKIGIAKRNNINIDYDIDIDSEIGIDQNDLAVIVYSLLNDAIESNLKIDNTNMREILIKIKMIHSMLFVVIKNAVNKKEGSNNIKNFSKNGYAFNKVKQIIEKYNGIIEKTIEANECEVCLFLNNINR